jgi:hypothetical protein
MAVVNINLDLQTGCRIATAPGFSGLLSRSPLNPDWFMLQVTTAPPGADTMLSGRLGTLDELKRAIEAAL